MPDFGAVVRRRGQLERIEGGGGGVEVSIRTSIIDAILNVTLRLRQTQP